MTSATTSSWTFARYAADSENGEQIRARSNVNIRLQAWAHVAGVDGGNLEGSVRDVRAYNQALSDGQIKALLDDAGIRINSTG